MRLLRPSIPEPPDALVAGLTIGDTPLGVVPLAGAYMPVLQGEYPPANMPGNAVPRAAIGWNPYFCVPSQIGPMAIVSGGVVMVPIGPAKAAPLDLLIDPVLKWLSSELPLDATAAWAPPLMPVPTVTDPIVPSKVLAGECVLSNLPPLTNPRTQVAISGMLKVMTAPTLIPQFGWTLSYPSRFETSDAFLLTGTTVTGAGVAEPNCRVIAYQSGWRYVDAGPKIIAETTSDGSGVFSLLLRNIDYQLVGYKEGSPDLGGVTRQDVTPVVATTIYMRNPTTADAPGGSAAFRVVGSPVVRRLR